MSHQSLSFQRRASGLDNQECFPRKASNNGVSHQELKIERGVLTKFHKSKEQNKEAFRTQGRMPAPWKRQLLHRVPDSVLKHIRPEDEEWWIGRFVEGLLDAERARDLRDKQRKDQLRHDEGHAIIRPQFVERWRLTDDGNAIPMLSPVSTGSLPIEIDEPEVSAPTGPVSEAEPPKTPELALTPEQTQTIGVPSDEARYSSLVSPASSHQKLDIGCQFGSSPISSKTLEEYAKSTHEAIQCHLFEIEAAAADLPAWHKLIHTPTSRRLQLHRWFGLYTTWENDVAFTAVDRERWRKALVTLAKDHNSQKRRGGTPGQTGQVLRVRTAGIPKSKGEISARIMKKRESWFV